jgi:hypothetical protein
MFTKTQLITITEESKPGTGDKGRSRSDVKSNTIGVSFIDLFYNF